MTATTEAASSAFKHCSCIQRRETAPSSARCADCACTAPYLETAGTAKFHSTDRSRQGAQGVLAAMLAANPQPTEAKVYQCTHKNQINCMRASQQKPHRIWVLTTRQHPQRISTKLVGLPQKLNLPACYLRLEQPFQTVRRLFAIPSFGQE